MTTMTALHHYTFATKAALLAALAILFVSTVSMACEVPNDTSAAGRSMAGDCGTPQRKAIKVVCQKACMVFCQGLRSNYDVPAVARVYTVLRYPTTAETYSEFTNEAEDPPPRPGSPQ